MVELKWDETAGYDCITAGWVICFKSGSLVVDEADFASKSAAEQTARMIAQRLSDN